MSTKYALERHIKPYLLLFGGIACLVPFLLNESLVLRAGQFVLLVFLAVQCKRIRLWYFVSLACSIVFFAILTPAGKSLFSVGGIIVTSQALIEGVQRAMTLLGFTFTSLWAVSTKLRLPGRFGNVFHRSLLYFSRIFSATQSLRHGNKDLLQKAIPSYKKEQSPSRMGLVYVLDSIVFSALSPSYQEEASQASTITYRAKIIVHIGFFLYIGIQWVLYLLQYQQ